VTGFYFGGHAAAGGGAKTSAETQEIESVRPGSAKAVPVLRLGSQGDGVKRLQQLLVASGSNIAVDGDFGPATEKAVRDFQSSLKGEDGRPLTSDGVVGSETWWALFRT
jgi:peptidoglycan hydrolase-like protein with peptidoglycan-binding domain